MTEILLSPHNDDETLFAAFTLLRRKPLVVIVTDSWVQFNRGDGITADQRWWETLEAMQILGCSAFRLGVRDDALTTAGLVDAFARFGRPSRVYAPAVQHGHPHHDLVSVAADEAFAGIPIERYCTYSQIRRSYANVGVRRIDGTDHEHVLKQAALACYRSQMPRSRHHFEAVAGQPEWLS